jgi:hypothetical protein
VVVKQMEWNIRLLSHPSSGQILDIGPESAWLAQLEDADPLKACLTNNIHLSQTSPSRHLQSAIINAADLARHTDHARSRSAPRDESTTLHVQPQQ